MKKPYGYLRLKDAKFFHEVEMNEERILQAGYLPLYENDKQAEPVACSQCKGLGYYDEGHECDDGTMAGGNYVECEKCNPQHVPGFAIGEIYQSRYPTERYFAPYWNKPLPPVGTKLYTHPAEPVQLDYEKVLEDHRRLVRELDVLINGEEGAAEKASLCDIVAQIKREGLKAQPVQPAGAINDRLLSVARKIRSRLICEDGIENELLVELVASIAAAEAEKAKGRA